ncbi:hypothetical protein COX86_01875 [Candidatus Micrarchaeota archaeon CG_4_10_14_0_2_um_filter_60_11]|nr:MAG: hypothetical protein AUJ16_03250 [Candidatus Micrarchaeota archaeon CG1_02_60_51]PIN96244.1 MAG: hypothetical protein COU39_02135 [Candidatus Micrarchaeota archaeon CG10_big_fil_rev_8_21_14_0_10_60_32]PIO02269.1 MAG: hypothetical protein COT58_00990 [Candidatus Micrarchaeota archaeon CG09_land_8_20_14_0_10_60_16]PIZ91018.1 MAG: hypothetical protein COX86_01875 [Candidatus Micrarchaeota archaeon CG_4_10_14_0_2_um_filter_60_11]
MGFWSEERAQVSIEMIIVAAAVVAVAVILVTQFQNTASQGGKKLSDVTDKAFDEIDSIK